MGVPPCSIGGTPMPRETLAAALQTTAHCSGRFETGERAMIREARWGVSCQCLGRARAGAGECVVAVDPSSRTRSWSGVNIIGYDPLWKSCDAAAIQGRLFSGCLRMRLQQRADQFASVPGMTKPRQCPAGLLVETAGLGVANALKSDLLVILDLHEFGRWHDRRRTSPSSWPSGGRCPSASRRSGQSPIRDSQRASRKLTAQMWNQYPPRSTAIIRKTNRGGR